MITWATTVAPQTESSYSFSNHIIRDQGPGGFRSITITVNQFTASYQNWSQTSGSSSSSIIAHTGPGSSRSDSYVSVLGTTNSTTFKTRVGNNFGTFVSNYEHGYTLRSVLNTTSTETTRQYTYRATGTTESTYSRPTTTAFDSVSLSTLAQPTATTITTSATLTASESATLTTTVINETIRTPILATVVVADKNEVIWAANSIAATGMSGLSAATALGTTATRTTIMPWTQTIMAAQGESTQTIELFLPLLSQAIIYASEQFTTAQTTTVENYEVLPHESQTTQRGIYQTLSTTRLNTVFAAQTLTATVSNFTETMVATSYVSMAATRGGVPITTTTTGSSTYTRDATHPFAFTKTSSETFTIRAFTGTTTYTWTGSESGTTHNNLTTFAPLPQIATTFSAGAISRSRDFYEGVANGSEVVGGYSCQSIGYVGGIFPQVSRGVVSVMPTIREYSRSYGVTFTEDNEEGGGTYSGTYEAYSLAGQLTVSHLSATILPESTTQTSSFELQPYGNGRLRFGGIEQPATRSAVNATSLGASETIYQTLAAGVYSTESSTFSTSGGCHSWVIDGGSQAAPIALSCIAPGTARNGASPIWWTVSRNSHPSLTALTDAGAYSAL